MHPCRLKSLCQNFKHEFGFQLYKLYHKRRHEYEFCSKCVVDKDNERLKIGQG